ncbi:MAG TPA: L-aspartate oxidase, partial [Patescibacteria group bacterium]|nr:L-aspartate oxidase [Patescibacteria group bacterium]
NALLAAWELVSCYVYNTSIKLFMQKDFFDFVVIGSGIAGLNSALSLAKHGKVLVVTKASINASSTFFAQGGIAAVTKRDDTIVSHITDTLEAGYYHNNKKAVTFLAKKGKEAIEKLINYGVLFDKQQDGDYVSSYEAAHSYPRILHATDFTGQEIQKALVSHVFQNKNIVVWEKTPAIDLLVKKNVCFGVSVLNNQQKRDIFARAVVIATGGAGQLYHFTTNPEVATGDGIALAKRAGASLSDLEFVQFHPTALKEKKSPQFLLSEALRGEGAYLVKSQGERFMKKLHPMAELAPRDVVARAIFSEQKTGDVYLDMRHKSKTFLQNRFPNIFLALKKRGYDLSQNLIPVTPASHFMCGGVVTDLYGRTSVTNLFAYGEVASTGVHGANRLASNSMLEGLVFSSQIEKCIDEMPAKPVIANVSEKILNITSPSAHRNDKKRITSIKQQLRQIMWDYVGIVRTHEGLLLAKQKIKTLQEELKKIEVLSSDVLETKNMLLTAQLIETAASQRQESLGTHHLSLYV